MDDDPRSISSMSLERRSDRHVGPDPSEEDPDPRIDIFPRGIDLEAGLPLRIAPLSLSDASIEGGVFFRAHDHVPQRKRRVAVPGKRSCVSQPNHSRQTCRDVDEVVCATERQSRKIARPQARV